MAIKAIVNNVEKEIIDVKMISGGNELNAWEVRDQQNRLIWGKEGTISGQTPLSFKAGGVPLTGMTLYGNTVQTGTPTPDNPIMPTFCGKLIDTDWTIPITCAGQTTPVYLGQVPTTRRVKKLVLTGDENLFVYQGLGYIRLNDGLGAKIAPYSDKLLGTDVATAHMPTFSIVQAPSDITPAILGIKTDFNFSSNNAFKTWLAENQITVWYVLATPTTAIVNEPLAKIGDYTDTLTSEQAGITIPTTDGNNIISVDTNLQPSSITISGHII